MARRLFLLLALAFGASGSAYANLILNPGFETGDFTNWSTSPGGGSEDVFECGFAVVGCATGGGTYFAILNNSLPFGVGAASVTQLVTLSGPGTYQFGAYVFYATTNPSGNFEQGQITLGLQVPGGPTSTIGYDPNTLSAQFTIPGGEGFSFTNWIFLSGSLTYAGVGPVSALINLNAQDFNPDRTLIFGFDQVFVQAVSAVPEPGTLALLGLGLLSLGLTRRKAA